MRLVSPFLKRVVYPGMHHTGWLKRIASSGGCAIVNYHGILPAGYVSGDSFLDGNLVSLEQLRKHLRFLKANYAVVRPADFRDWLLSRDRKLPERAVLVTCDDGLATNLDMLPVFQAEGIDCLFFVTGASCSGNRGMLWYEELYRLIVGGVSEADLQSAFSDGTALAGAHLQARWWRAVIAASRLGAAERAEKLAALRLVCSAAPAAQPASSDRRWRLMNVDELRQMAEAGAAIGAHTMSHPVLSECAPEECFREIHESKVALEAALGRRVWAFAYPFGNPATMGEREVAFAREAGFECAFLNAGGGFAERADPYALSRTHITAEMSLAELEAHMIGFHTRLQRAVRG
jgi:peptidoglycan/xylan/chitin deacetylase (PgdA/CDA1 family)